MFEVEIYGSPELLSMVKKKIFFNCYVIIATQYVIIVT